MFKNAMSAGKTGQDLAKKRSLGVINEQAKVLYGFAKRNSFPTAMLRKIRPIVVGMTSFKIHVRVFIARHWVI